MRFGDGSCPRNGRSAIEAYVEVPSVRDLLARCGACASDIAAIKEVLALEWAFFDQVKGLEGRAACQDDARSFFIYRLAQYLVFPFAFVHLVLDDLKSLDAAGRNPVAEKYARMMAVTDPERFRADWSHVSRRIAGQGMRVARGRAGPYRICPQGGRDLSQGRGARPRRDLAAAARVRGGLHARRGGAVFAAHRLVPTRRVGRYGEIRCQSHSRCVRLCLRHRPLAGGVDMSCTHNSAEASCHDDLYRIGEVSQIGGLSQRALRHYDDMKLIEPDVIGENSYRYYSRRTMLKIPVINYLKKMGLSLEEIADVFDCTDFSHIRRSFREQRAECARAVRELNERLEIIDDWNELVEEASFVLNSCPLAVNTKFLSCEELLCMPYRFTGDYAEATINLEFTAFVDKVENVISGPVIMKREFGDAEPETFTAPCDAAILQKALRPIDPKYAYVRPRGLYLSTYHSGAFENIDVAYRRLFAFAKQNGHQVCGCSYERFVTDYWTTYDSDLFVTEILVPIKG